MANRKYSDRVPDGTSNPLKAADLIGVSNEDGGGGFDLSKKITMQEVADFLSTALGVAITADFIAIGNGTGIEDGTGKANGIVGDEDALYIAQKDFFNVDDYAFWQGDGGDSQMNAPSGNIAVISIDNQPKITVSDGVNSGVELGFGSSDVIRVGGTGGDAKFQIKSMGNDDTTFGIEAFDSDDVLLLSLRDDGQLFLTNGTGVNNISTDSDFSGATDDELKTALAIKDFVESQSSGGWLGSETRIKIAPWDVVSYNDKDGVSIQDDGGVVNDAAAKITTMVTGVFIPTGYRATAFMINASANIAVELFESQIDDSTAVSKGSGNANTEVNITNVDSTTTNYLSIIIVEAGNDIYGGYITIEKI